MNPRPENQATNQGCASEPSYGGSPRSTVPSEEVQALRDERARLLAKIKHLESSNHYLSDFIASVSHEIRTPMTAIIGFADLLYEDGDISLAPRQRIQTIDTIQRNSRYLLQVINDILDVSKIEAGRFEIHPGEFSLVDLVADVWSLMSVRARSKDLAFDVECVDPLPELVVADMTRVKQILINLTGNAIKFTEDGGVRLITRCLSGAENAIQFTVIDTGVGMTKAQQDELFDRYGQFHGDPNDRYGGTGLGLYISQRLANLMGGEIEVESTVGKGSMFRTTLPVVIPQGLRFLQDARAAMVGRPDFDSKPNTDKQLPGISVLLAEDGVDNRRLLQHILTKAGATLEMVENGKEAVDLALQADRDGRPYDVVMMDLQMPVMDGLQATRLLRKEHYRGPIIAITAHSAESDARYCLDAGFDAHVCKPIDKAKLLRTVSKIMKAHRPGTGAAPAASQRAAGGE